MSEEKAKKRLLAVSQRWNLKITIEQVLGIYKNSEKYTLERQLSLLKQLFKNFVSEFDKHQAQFETDVKKNKKTAYEAFIYFLNTVSILPATQKPQIAAKPTNPSSSKSEFESPVLSSTRLDNNGKSDIIVSEVSDEGRRVFDS